METIPYTNGKAVLSSNTKLGLVHLRVKNLKNQILFYTQALKMTLHSESETEAILGDTEHGLLHLQVHPEPKRYNNTTGMYHFALLYPNEKELAKALAWLYAIKYEHIPTDHGMSKTSYLKDLEGNDIELYIRTLDRATYVKDNGVLQIKYNDGTMTDGRDPLDLDELFSNLDESDDIQSPLKDMEMGHIHLYGSNLDEMVQFYTNVIGFSEGVIDPKFRMGDVGLDSIQNHVIAFNSWKQTDFEAPEDAVGLDYYTLVLSNQHDYDALMSRLIEANIEIIHQNDKIFIKDPSHIKIRIELQLNN